MTIGDKVIEQLKKRGYKKLAEVLNKNRCKECIVANSFCAKYSRNSKCVDIVQK